VPPHLRDSHYSGAKAYGHGVGYQYTHDQPEQQQDFLPPELLNRHYVAHSTGKIVGKNRMNQKSTPESRPNDDENPSHDQ